LEKLLKTVKKNPMEIKISQKELLLQGVYILKKLYAIEIY